MPPDFVARGLGYRAYVGRGFLDVGLESSRLGAYGNIAFKSYR